MFKYLQFILCTGCMFLSFQSYSQVNLELYGGPATSYMDFETIPSNAQANNQPYNQLSYHLGVGALTRLTDHWQVTMQAELFVRSMAVKNPNNFGGSGFAFMAPTNYEMPTLALGTRYSRGNDNYGFYVQPSVGFTLIPSEIRNPNSAFSDNIPEFNRTVTQVNPYGIGLRIEAGLKKYISNRNYFLIGIRHQQGLRVTDEMTQTTSPAGQPEVSVFGSSRSSYTGIFIGFGLNTGSLKK